MASCGYLCPVCEGKGFKEDGSDCDWCTIDNVGKKKEVILKSSEQSISASDLEEWIEKVHQGPCCSDREE